MSLLHRPPAKTRSEPLRARETLRLYWQAARRHPLDLYLSALYPLGMVALGVGVPFFVGRILANIINPAANLNMYLLQLSAVSLLGIILYHIGFSGQWRLQAKVMHDFQRRSLDVLLRRSVGFHSNNVSGKLVSDALDFQASIGQFLGSAIIGMLPFMLVLATRLTVVSLHSWHMGLGLAVIMTITIGWAIIESRTRAALRNQRLVVTKHMTGHFSDTIINAQAVKAFAGEAAEAKRHQKLSTKLLRLRIKDWGRATRSGSQRMFVLLAFQVGFLALAVPLVRRDPALLGIGIFAFTYTFMLIQRLFEINTLTRQIEEALLQASPMTGIFLQDIEIKDRPDARRLRPSRGEIELKDVVFRYADSAGGQPVFDSLSLHVQPGEKIGLAGPSGGGKSTLTRLLLRFEDIKSGEILIDGQSIADVTQVSLREAIAYVPQEPLLFHRSIRENIAYGRANASLDEVITAAKQAHAHEFIKTLPGGYDTIVGERGVKLSGGQRQRVAIARAILKDAPILVLDEATSALDSESEVLVQQALWKLMEGRTALVIAHRLSTIQKMDKIVVLQDGRITEQGPHAALIKQKGVYARLWKHQSGGFVQDEP